MSWRQIKEDEKSVWAETGRAGPRAAGDALNMTS